jgi:deoxyribodipyrimidine photo-lyase
MTQALLTQFPPTREAAYARLAAVNPAAYARTRNALDGAVTRLSPYLTHGLLSLREVHTAVHARYPLDAKHKLVFELGWRAYWHHVWEHLGDDIHQSLHAGLLHDDAYLPDMPTDVLEARTGIAAIDMAVRELYATGYLHNHARMWLASYVVHLRKVHWHAGAQWMLGHLLDGDVASNHLSWQWVAGTGSSKPYLFNADNVAKYAAAQWHSPGTAIDTSYEALDHIARDAAVQLNPAELRANATSVRADSGVAQPALHNTPPGAEWCAPDGTLVAGRDVLLLHPWSMGAIPPTARADVLVIGIGLPPCHAQTPWSTLRWRFVTEGLQAQITQPTHLWWGDVAQVAQALQAARSVTWQANPHVDGTMAAVQTFWTSAGHDPLAKPYQQPPLFAPVDKHCHSFSEWWRRTHLIDPQIPWIVRNQLLKT